MKAGIAFSAHSDASRAGREAASRAVALSGPPRLAIIFTTDAYPPQTVLEAVLRETGEAKLVGFCCGGILADDAWHPQGVGICTLGGKIRVRTTLQSGLDRDPFDTGCRAADALLTPGDAEGTLLVLPDGFEANLSELLRGLYSRFGAGFQYVGGGAGDNLKFFKTYQVTDQGCASHAVAAAVIQGLNLVTRIGHGWVPMGDPLVMTRTRGKIVYEIDGMPAFKAYQQHLGPISREEFKAHGMLHPLGFPDVFGRYTIRDPLAVNDDDSIRFVNEVPSQAVGNIMDGHINQLIETAGKTVREAVSAVPDAGFLLLFDCISRAMLMGDRFPEELRAIRKAAGPRLPILGALTFGEIGAAGDVPLLHNKTTVAVAGGPLPA